MNGRPPSGPSQYDPSLTPEEQNAACGPAAAVCFCRYLGLPITIRQAVDVARHNNLWSERLGMYGWTAEVRLLELLGVAVRTEEPDWYHLAAEIRARRPAIVDTREHYFWCTDYSADDEAFYVGSSGMVWISEPSEWMDRQQIESHGGAARRMIYLQGG